MTTNRREFLQIGVSATAWPLVARTMQATGIEPLPELVPLSLVVYDTRFAESIAFAERCAALGLRTRAIEADMTRLWYDEIYHYWRAGAQPIAGLTAHGPLFCFAELARDVRMRLVFRAEHQLGPDGLMAHDVNGPETMVSEAIGACERERSGGLGAAMAGVITRCPIGRTEITSARAGIERRQTNEDALYTWMIAPAVRG
jgi:hypothetical protein